MAAIIEDSEQSSIKIQIGPDFEENGKPIFQLFISLNNETIKNSQLSLIQRIENYQDDLENCLLLEIQNKTLQDLNNQISSSQNLKLLDIQLFKEQNSDNIFARIPIFQAENLQKQGYDEIFKEIANLWQELIAFIEKIKTKYIEYDLSKYMDKMNFLELSVHTNQPIEEIIQNLQNSQGDKLQKLLQQLKFDFRIHLSEEFKEKILINKMGITILEDIKNFDLDLKFDNISQLPQGVREYIEPDLTGKKLKDLIFYFRQLLEPFGNEFGCSLFTNNFGYFKVEGFGKNFFNLFQHLLYDNE